MTATPNQWTDEAIASFWEYETLHPQRFFANQLGDRVVENLRGFFPSGNLLDYGCGSGAILSSLLRSRSRVSGCEFSEAMVQQVNERFHHHENFGSCFTINELARHPDAFDAVLATEVIEHLLDDHLSRFLALVHQVLTPGGRLLLTTPNSETLDKNFFKCPFCKQEYHRWQHVRSWNTDSLTKHLLTAGFTPVAVFATDFTLDYDLKKQWERLAAGVDLQTPPLLHTRLDRLVGFLSRGAFSLSRFQPAILPDAPHLVGVFEKSAPAPN